MIESGLVVPYVDRPAYSDRLTLAAGFGRWTSEYNVQVIDGVNRGVRSGDETKEIRTAKIAVICGLTITGLGTQAFQRACTNLWRRCPMGGLGQATRSHARSMRPPCGWSFPAACLGRGS